MIIEIEKEFQSTVKQIQDIVESKDCRPDILYGDLYTVIAVEGDATKLDLDHFQNFPGVVRAWRITSPYKTISRRVIGHSHQKVERKRRHVQIRGEDGEVRQFRDDRFMFIVGPCAVESYEQSRAIGLGVAELADKYQIRDRVIFRGGAFKPRTRPWDFRGLGEEGLDILDKVREETGLPYVTEVMAVAQVDLIAAHADMLQIGMRNFQNFDLLEAVGSSKKPVLYKRGIAAQLEEWLSAAEYIALQGNKDIILCERGVKSTTHGDYNRSHIDFDVVPAIKQRTILPVVIDPSHAAGYADLVPYQFKATLAYEANGAMVEVITDSISRKDIQCDARQAMRLKDLEQLIQYQIKMEAIGKEI